MTNIIILCLAAYVLLMMLMFFLIKHAKERKIKRIIKDDERRMQAMTATEYDLLNEEIPYHNMHEHETFLIVDKQGQLQEVSTHLL